MSQFSATVSFQTQFTPECFILVMHTDVLQEVYVHLKLKITLFLRGNLFYLIQAVQQLLSTKIIQVCRWFQSLDADLFLVLNFVYCIYYSFEKFHTGPYSDTRL